jgi:hypothetical protein
VVAVGLIRHLEDWYRQNGLVTQVLACVGFFCVLYPTRLLKLRGCDKWESLNTGAPVIPRAVIGYFVSK